MSTNNENNKNGESLTINFQTAQLDPIDISRKMLLFNSMQNKHFKNHNDNCKVVTILIYRSRSWSADHFLIWSQITFYHFSRSRSWSDFRSLSNWSWSDFKITFSDHFFQKTRIFLRIIYSQIPNKVLGIANRS